MSPTSYQTAPPREQLIYFNDDVMSNEPLLGY
jgi:hypothetical protein